jgi:hypothetical protein
MLFVNVEPFPITRAFCFFLDILKAKNKVNKKILMISIWPGIAQFIWSGLNPANYGN